MGVGGVGQRRSMGSEQFKLHIDPGVQQREDKPPWLVAGPVGLRRGLWEAWTLPVKSA